MTKEGWRMLILDCYNDKKRLNLLSELLEQVDLSKQILIDKGYSCTGMSLLEVVKNLSDNTNVDIDTDLCYDDRFDEFS